MAAGFFHFWTTFMPESPDDNIGESLQREYLHQFEELRHETDPLLRNALELDFERFQYPGVEGTIRKRKPPQPE